MTIANQKSLEGLSALPGQTLRTIAFYLPQFHRIHENDSWWGPGFTEWSKVAAARPLYVGHYQPHVPSDLGFYDLRVAESRSEQATLARRHGIDAFCYWHYWFHGRRLLERPLSETLSSGEPDFPFCLCWANENWTRRWDGHEDEILVEQRYSAEDDRAHMAYLAEAFRDRRYLQVDGRPLLLIYRARRLPDPLATATRLREEAFRLGVGEIFLCCVESFPDERGDPRAIGFDAAVEFQPDWSLLTKDLCTGPVRVLGPNGDIVRLSRAFQDDSVCAVYDYAAVVDRMIAKPPADYLRFPCVVPMWDNSPRRGSINNSVILHGSTPGQYERWLRAACSQARQVPGQSLVFINAWNEWAEGAHLEPDLRYGRGYLEATKRAVGHGMPQLSAASSVGSP
jgi:lipopolysaccharide biosynthesis protein